MGSRIYFVQGCPICGRRLNIRIEYLGRRLFCRHCKGQFVAQDPANGAMPDSETLRRAQQLLNHSVSKFPPPSNSPLPGKPSSDSIEG